MYVHMTLEHTKGFMLKKAYVTPKSNTNNTEKSYNDLVVNNIAIDDVLYKNANKELSNKNKNIFQNANSLLYLRVEIYKKLVYHTEKPKPKPEETIVERTKLEKQRLNEIKAKERSINNELFKYYFANCLSPSNMYKILSNLESTMYEFEVK